MRISTINCWTLQSKWRITLNVVRLGYDSESGFFIIILNFGIRIHRS